MLNSSLSPFLDGGAGAGSAGDVPKAEVQIRRAWVYVFVLTSLTYVLWTLSLERK